MYAYKSHRSTWAEINIDNLLHNLKVIKSKFSNDVSIIGVVKADAYGHGAVNISSELIKVGVDYLAISNIDEAIELRSSGISSSIVLLGPVETNEISKLMEFNIYPTITDYNYAKTLSDAFKFRGIFNRVHIKVDTGMGRLGIPIENAFEEILRIASLDGLIIDGIFSHFPSADYDVEFSNEQTKMFSNLIENLQKENIRIKYFHIANSAGIFNVPSSVSPPYNMVRPGIALYGYQNWDNKCNDLKNVMSLKSRIIYINKLSKGKTVSYGRSYTVKDDYEYIAILPIGYADGVPINYSQVGFVCIKGKRYKICGRICMDYTMVSLGRNPDNVKVEDEAVFFGNNSDITLENFAELCGKIPYEAVCSITKRVPRIYIRKEDQLV